jgi:hypothetical protein
VGANGANAGPGQGELGQGPGCFGRVAASATAGHDAVPDLEFALTGPGVRAVCAHVEPSNPSSVRVLEKAGFQPVGVAEGVARFRFTKADPAQP